MEQNLERKIAYINGEWSQSLANANNKIAGLIMELEGKDAEIGRLHEDIKNLQSEMNRLKDSEK